MAHITLNGQDYRLDESGEGQHYLRSHQPLRPPNAQLIQGEAGRFQLRPDLLQWSWTDWSSGENQIKLNREDGGRAYILQNVNPFRRRGELSLGYKATIAAANDGSVFVHPGTLVKAFGDLFLVSSSTDDVFKYNTSTERFSLAEDVTSGSGTSPPNSSIGDQQYLFRHAAIGNNIHRRTSGGTWDVVNNQCNLTGETILVELGDYVYIWEPLSGKVYEISKGTVNTTDAETEIHNVPISSAINADQFLMVAGDNRIYLVASINGESYIHEIVPTSAAGTGFGSELAKIPGITAECIFYSGGTIFIVGYDKQPDDSVGPDRQIFYIDPQGTYGTLGSLRGFTDTNGPSTLYPVPAGGRLALSALALPGTWEDESATQARMSLFEIDQISGGIAMTASDGGHLIANEQATSLVYFDGKYFVSLTNKVIEWEPNFVEDVEVGYAVSPSNDFSIAGEKILEKLELICDPLPAGTNITVQYQLDGGSWSGGTIVSATGATGGALQTSDDTTTRTFRSLKLRIKLTPSGGNAPVVKSLDAYARVNRRLRVWDLILDLADDRAHGYNGAKLLSNLANISENKVIAFVDRYLSHDATDGGTSLDVIVDTLQFDLSQAGEGRAIIRIIEVL